MFSSMKSFERNLPYSQRFNYDNYDFYNLYENLQEDYRDDLSKFIYHSKRKTKPTIINFAAKQVYARHKHERFVPWYLNGKKVTMEQFLDQFLQVYLENNYSAHCSQNHVDYNQDQFNLVHICDFRNREESLLPYPVKISFNLDEQLKTLASIIEKKKEFYEAEFQNAEEEVFMHQCNFSIEDYAQTMLKVVYERGEDEENSIYYHLLKEFTYEIHFLLWQIINGQIWNVLLFAQPKISYLDYLIHPLLLPICTFSKLKKQEFKFEDKAYSSMEHECPRIVFINLDGKESPHNIRIVQEMGGEIFYVSVYKEHSWLEKKDIELEKYFEQQDEKTSFELFCNLYSENIVKEFAEKKFTPAKLLLLPLNSFYLQKQFKKRNKSSLPSLQTSQDIHFLFEHIIIQQIEKFKPSIVFMSYNGQLNVEEDYFIDIVRNLTILSHHKVILFPNFVHFFDKQNFLQTKLDEVENQKTFTINEFQQKYWQYNPNNINQQRLWANISSFLKISSGIHSLEEREFGNMSSKYIFTKRLQYLQKISEMDGFKFIDNYQLKKWRSKDLELLFKNYGARELKENKKQNENYERLLDSVIDEFLLREITEKDLNNFLDKRILFRRKMILAELEPGGNEDEDMMQNEEESEFQIYLKDQKEKLLLENMETYKTKRVFNLSEGLRKMGHVQCFKISMEKQDNDQIYLEKYSQIFINDHLETAFLINYKSNDNRHIICSMRLTSIDSSTKAREVQLTQLQQSQELTEEFKLQQLKEGPQKQDIIYVNYNHCFFKKYLYLFWPQKWDLKEEARCKLLGLQYKPKNVQKMIRIFSQPHQESASTMYKYENVYFRPKKVDIQILPCIGCSSHPIDERRFLIFGGFYDNEEDFLKMGMGIHCFEIDEEDKAAYYRITTKQKKNFQNIVPCLPRKVNYYAEENFQKNEEKMDMIIRISGGYGRENTNNFSMFSYDTYELDSLHCIPKKIIDPKVQRRIPRLNKPFQINQNGKYNCIINLQNISQMEEKFSDGLKDKFIFENKLSESGKSMDQEVLVFIQENHRISNFKQEQKKSFLSGFNRIIRQKIYSQFWSPQLYIVDGIKEQIVTISLKIQKQINLAVSNFFMPREEDIISLWIEEDIIYMLAVPSILDSVESSGNRYALYSGSLSNMNQIFAKKELQMSIKYQFKKKDKFLPQKGILLMNENIFLVGGVSELKEGNKKVYEREDFILQKYKNRLKLKLKKLESEEDNLELPYPIVVKTNDQCFLYSLSSEQVNQGNEIWKIKIETFSQNQKQMETVRVGDFKTYFYNKKSNRVQIYSQDYLESPKFVRISPYVRFNMSVLRELFSKILWRMKKSQNLNGQSEMKDEENQQMQKFINSISNYQQEANDEQLKGKIISEYYIIEKVIEKIRKKPTDEKEEMSNEEEELLKDLKHYNSLVSKMILQSRLYPQEPNEPEYRFFVEDKSSKKIKYIAIGPLNTTKLNFFRIRFKHEMFLCVNQEVDEGFFYHPLFSSCIEIENENLRGKEITNMDSMEEVRKILVK